MKVLCIIPARGGSKGIKEKNIKSFLGKPLIYYAIKTALNHDDITLSVVSTEDKKICDISEQYGIDVINRPYQLSEDDSSITDVISHVITSAEKKYSIDFEAILLLQPTAPLRTYTQIKDCIKLLQDNPSIASVVSVCEMYDMHPARMYKLDLNQNLISYMPEFETNRRQDLPVAFYRNGAIYIVRKKEFLSQKIIMAKPAVPYIMPIDYLANIDDERDWIIAEAMAKKIKLNESF